MRATIVSCGIVLASSLLFAQAVATPNRVFVSAKSAFSDFDAMLDDLAKVDVVFVGEQHDSQATHRLELAILQGVAARRPDAIVAMEMFERDVQEPFDHFQMGHTSEEDFLASARPWPRYATDYKPLVDFAISKNWPVIASNVPRSFASEVAKGGLDVLQAKSADEQKWFAHDLKCPTDDEYFKLFTEAMGGHPAAPGSGEASIAAARQTLERTYFAQCLKDETMGESVATAYGIGAIGGKSPLVIHVNGAFHSDFGLGTAERAKRRLPDKRIVVVTVLPVDKLDTVSAPSDSERKRADYLIYTSK
ncbi:MAG TPA: ChaN family lipoprotein [Vicinamibacterales bacterium]|nr:ChaN family lipoprotein [Vicinamibacterales bacterium]